MESLLPFSLESFTVCVCVLRISAVVLPVLATQNIDNYYLHLRLLSDFILTA
jgi:hypothetical protein